MSCEKHNECFGDNVLKVFKDSKVFKVVKVSKVIRDKKEKGRISSPSLLVVENLKPETVLHPSQVPPDIRVGHNWD